MNKTTDITLDDRIFIFETVMRVRSTETDFGQHMSMESLTSTLIEALKRFFYSRGIKDIDTDYQGLIVNKIAVNTLSFVRAREELLYEIGVSKLMADGGSIIIKISRMFDSSLVAKARIHFVSYDYRLNQVVTLSQSIINALDTPPFEDDPDTALIL